MRISKRRGTRTAAPVSNEERIRARLPGPHDADPTSASEEEHREIRDVSLPAGERAHRLGLDVLRHEARRCATYTALAALLSLPLLLRAEPRPAEYTLGSLLLLFAIIQVWELSRRLADFDRAVTSRPPASSDGKRASSRVRLPAILRGRARLEPVKVEVDRRVPERRSPT